MPGNCCVPNCTKKLYRTENGKIISYFKFPDDVNLKKRWLHAIRRDEGKEFTVNQNKKICSHHFIPEDFVKSIGGQRIYLREGVVPSRFFWSQISPLKRKPPKRRMFTSNTDTELLSLPLSQTTSATETNADNCTSSAAGSSPDHDVQNDTDTQRNTTEYFKELLEKLKSLELEKNSLKAEIEVLKRQKGLADSRVFQLRNFSSDEDIAFYTGFPNFATFNAVHEFLNTGKNGENIRYCSSKERSVPKCFYDENENETEEPEECTLKGRKRSLEAREEFFLVLCRLRRGFAEQHLTHLFHISQSTVSRIFLSWINYLYPKFGQVSIWANKEVVTAAMPDSFKDKYSSTRVIIDCTEIRCQMPSSLLLNFKLVSSYKNYVTLKGLVGIAPSGAITFISQLYSGSISDRKIVERSGFLKLEFDKGDTVMAD